VLAFLDMPAQGFPGVIGKDVLAGLDLGFRDPHLGEAREDGGIVAHRDPACGPAECFLVLLLSFHGRRLSPFGLYLPIHSITISRLVTRVKIITPVVKDFLAIVLPQAHRRWGWFWKLNCRRQRIS